MSALILDAGALIAIDRGDRHVLARVEDADRDGRPGWPGHSARSQWIRLPAKTGCRPASFSGRAG